MSHPRIPFAHLEVGDDPLVHDAIDRVLARGWFVLGPEVEAFETEFAAASGARHAVGVASGTDAIALLLTAAGIGSGDEVIVPAMTAGFTALAVLSTGATPVVADVEPDTLTLSPSACAAAITEHTAAIIPVHLYGQPADLDAIREIAARHRLAIVEDCCQAHLATCKGQPVGTHAVGGAFSFYPTKNLGALGDGGAIVTDDPAVAERVRRLRNGGQTIRYHHAEAGMNSRLDELQAAVLRVRLSRLPSLTARRRALARLYRQSLGTSVPLVTERDPGHVYHLFPVLSPQRDALQNYLDANGIETLIHYPVPLSDQPALTAGRSVDCPVAARAAGELLSLPLHPRLSDTDAYRIAESVNAFQKGRALA